VPGIAARLALSLKGWNKSAQGNALGTGTKPKEIALKGNAVKDFFSPKTGVSVNWAI
jgi:hypothetical protein